METYSENVRLPRQQLGAIDFPQPAESPGLLQWGTVVEHLSAHGDLDGDEVLFHRGEVGSDSPARGVRCADLPVGVELQVMAGHLDGEGLGLEGVFADHILFQTRERLQ